MIAGAIIGQKANKKAALVLFFAFASHFVLDFVPHFEYVLKPPTLFLDLSLGMAIAAILAYKYPPKTKLIIASAFVAILPDAPSLAKIVTHKIGYADRFDLFLNQLILAHNYFHTELSFIVPAAAMRIILLASILLAIVYFIKMIVPKLKKGREIKPAEINN